MSIYDKSSLVLIPSGTKTSKVYSQKPTNGDGDFDFTRSTAATRIAANGNIEKETQNLLLQSNSFNTSPWNLSSATMSGGQSGYDGSSDAWIFTTSVAGAANLQSFSSTGVLTYSVYAKAGSVNGIRLRIDTNSDADGFFNLVNGTIFQSSGIDASIEDVGGGWYRCSLAHNVAGPVKLQFFTTNGTTSYDNGSIYIQDAQLEQGMVARDYIETTTTALYGGITDNVPRLDYTDSSCPALLLEPQRTNLTPQSEYFGSGYTFTNVTTAANAAISPEGVSNAYEMTDDATNGNHRFIRQITGNTIGQSYTYSIFLKKGTMTNAFLNLFSGGTIANVSVDLENGTISGGSGTSQTIEDYGNDWYRCSITGTAGDPSVYIYLYMNSLGGYVGAGDNMYFYGSQIEAGSYPTSYIPTYGTSVTRNADIFKVNNIGTNNLITNDAFTLFIDIASVQDSENSFRDLVSIFGSKNFRLETRTSGQVRSQQIGMVTSGDNFNSVTIGTYNIRKFAFTFTTTQCKMYVDGALHSTYNGVYTHDFNVLSVRNSSSLGAELKNEYRKVMLFPTALSEQEAIDLTTI